MGGSCLIHEREEKRMQYLVRILEGRISHLDDVGLGEGILQDRQRAV
jgi:hypothetical protein